MTIVLRKTVGSWSAGTRVEVISHPDDEVDSQSPIEGYAAVRVLAGDDPIIDVLPEDIVERRQRAGAITRGVGGGTEGTTAEGTEVQES